MNLGRLFRPRSIAIVGASDSNGRSAGVMKFMKDSDVPVFLVNPNQKTIHGQPGFPSLGAVGQPVDAVLSLVNAERTPGVVAEAASLGAGGVVVIAGGFRELGDAGAALERKLVDAAGGMPILGPNCNGFTDFVRRVKMSGHPPLPSRSGGVGLVTHSGGMIGAVAFSGYDRVVGLSHAISVGNETVIDMTDCIDFLIDDPATKVITLIIEGIRRPAKFFAAVDRAIQAGKPVIALKLARAERSQQLAKSHTGSIVAESWVYDIALRQHGVIPATTIADLVDKTICFDQFPASKWNAAKGVAVLSTSGGGASLTNDFFAEQGMELPELLSLRDKVDTFVPGTIVANPLDMTGFSIASKELRDGVFNTYASSDEVDTLLVQWFVDETALTLGGPLLDHFVEFAQGSSKTFIVNSIDDCRLGPWAEKLPQRGVAIVRGLEGSVRALKGLQDFARSRSRQPCKASATPTTPIGRPNEKDIIQSTVGPILTFDASMKLLASAGIRTGPYVVVDNPEQNLGPIEAIDGPLVVKLADVPHRTELDAVRLGVTRARLAETVRELQAKATELGVPRSVAIQRQVTFDSEAFIGLQTGTPVGPVVVFGVGGIFLEVLKRVTGVASPFSPADVEAMLDDLGPARVFESFRGRPAWDKAKLVDAITSVGRLAAGSASWLDSLDINPLAFAGGEFVALDCLCTIKTGA